MNSSETTPRIMDNGQVIPRLIADIKLGRCALILGPEIFSANGEPLQIYLRNELTSKFEDQIAAYHERDGFFMLHSSEYKTEMQDELKYLYEQVKPDWEVLQKIAEIPFSLVLSVNADTWLRDKAFELGLSHRFAWFNPEHGQELDMPPLLFGRDEDLRERTPLYYNLCGCTEAPSSFILDYDDLFRLLEGMLGAPRLPEKLLSRLKDTTSYLFLGFQFDRWHTQMLLRLLDVKNAARRFAIQSHMPAENDNKAFIMKHFKIKFLGDDEELIQAIYDGFKLENLLRPTLSDGHFPNKQYLINYLQNGDLDSAIQLLRQESAGRDYENESIQISARYADLNRETDLLPTFDYDIKRNRIVDSILQVLKLM